MSGVLAAISSGIPGIINGALPTGAAAGTATFQLLNDGTYSISTGQTGNWVTPATAGLAALYEVMVTETTGVFTSGTADAWLALSSTRTWTVDAASVTFSITFREAGGTIRSTQNGVVLDGT